MQTVTGISRPPCTSGDRRCLESITVTVTFPPREMRKRVHLEISLGK